MECLLLRIIIILSANRQRVNPLLYKGHSGFFAHGRQIRRREVMAALPRPGKLRFQAILCKFLALQQPGRFTRNRNQEFFCSSWL
jgi:hypothetical protein